MLGAIVCRAVKATAAAALAAALVACHARADDCREKTGDGICVQHAAGNHA